MRPGSSPGRAALAVSALLLGACDRGTEPVVTETVVEWPAGTVLVVDEVPLSAAEVDEVAGWVRELYPEYTRAHARRLALTNFLLPRAAYRAQHAEEMAAALERCRAARAAIDAHAGDAREVRGGLQAIGLPLWGRATRLSPDSWSDPIELPGRYVLVRVVHHERAPSPVAEVLELRVLDFLGGGREASLDARVQASVDASRLTVVDPEYGGLVPEAWKRRMGSSGP